MLKRRESISSYLSRIPSFEPRANVAAPVIATAAAPTVISPVPLTSSVPPTLFPIHPIPQISFISEMPNRKTRRQRRRDAIRKEMLRVQSIEGIESVENTTASTVSINSIESAAHTNTDPSNFDSVVVNCVCEALSDSDEYHSALDSMEENDIDIDSRENYFNSETDTVDNVDTVDSVANATNAANADNVDGVANIDTINLKPSAEEFVPSLGADVLNAPDVPDVSDVSNVSNAPSAPSTPFISTSASAMPPIASTGQLKIPEISLDDLYNSMIDSGVVLKSDRTDSLLSQSHYTWWRIPVWHRESPNDNYQLLFADMSFWEFLPCNLYILRSLTNVFTENDIWLLSDSLLIQCSGCSGCSGCGGCRFTAV